LIVGRGIAIAFGTLAGSHRLALRIACETAVYAGLSIGHATVARRYDGWCPTSADPGVAVKANAEKATADAVAILPIVFITFSDKVEPPWALAVIKF
jgi:hypothetical protein